MPTTALLPRHREALLALLDDPSPTVHAALLAEFNRVGTPALDWLDRVVHQGSRRHAWHARRFLEELRFTDPVAEFRGFIRSMRYELETGSLLLARTVRPHLDVGAICTQLDRLAARCSELFVEPLSLREKCRILNRVLFAEFGLSANLEHYTDPANSFLDLVLERRKGIPISLSLVYLLVAHRLGLPLEPVGLPGHFVVGCYAEEMPFFVDCFEGGVFRSAPELFAQLRAQNFHPTITDLAPTPVREVLCRCCRNLVHHFTAADEPERALLFASFVDEFEQTYQQQTRG